MSDKSFAQGVCASCACLTLARELRQCVFPPRECAEKPPWVDIAAEKWNLTHHLDGSGNRVTVGMHWFDAVNSHLDVVNYEETYFHITTRLQDAKHVAQRNPQDEVAQLWSQRVIQWATNIRKDLRDDGVWKPGSDYSAVGSVREKWLLYGAASQWVALDGTVLPQVCHDQCPPTAALLNCSLCQDCASALGNASPKMPWKARARGMWRGPEPDCFKDYA